MIVESLLEKGNNKKIELIHYHLSDMDLKYIEHLNNLKNNNDIKDLTAEFNKEKIGVMHYSDEGNIEGTSLDITLTRFGEIIFESGIEEGFNTYRSEVIDYNKILSNYSERKRLFQYTHKDLESILISSNKEITQEINLIR